MDYELRKELITSRESIPDYLTDIIRSEGVITGSYIFGGYDPDKSDIDILLPRDVEYKNEYGEIRHFSERTFENYMVYVSQDYRDTEFTTVYVKTRKGMILNLFMFYDNSDFRLWCKATKLMKKICKLKHVRKIVAGSKHKRIALFEALKVLYYVPTTGDDVPLFLNEHDEF
jgi:hypothetical protein